MAQPAVIGVDLGTTGIKVALFTPDGRRLGQGAARYPLSHPAPGAAEQDPGDWWAGMVEAVRAATDGADVDVEALTVVGQGPTLVAVDAAGEPVRPAICWMDNRAYAQQTAMVSEIGLDGFLLGNLPKIAWMEAEEADLAARTRWYLSAWDYMALRLGAEAVTAMPPTRSQATPEMAEQAGLDPARVPPLADWGTGIGTIAPAVAAELGISPRCLVVSGGTTPFRATSAPESLQPDKPSTTAARRAVSPSTGTTLTTSPASTRFRRWSPGSSCSAARCPPRG